ncbi:MAG: hypothetical protein QXJ14_03710 [Candidatus Aenigmatarchaeota archaeon]
MLERDNMEMKNILEKVWERERKELGFLPLKNPRIEKREGFTAYIDLRNKEIVIGKKFIEDLFNAGMNYEDIFKGICRHEGGHYRFHPYDVYTILLELYALKQYDEGKFGGKKAEDIRLFFDDVVDNMYQIVNSRDHGLDRLYKGMPPIYKQSRVMKLLCAYYSEMSGLDFGVSIQDLDNDLKNRLEKLKKIDFLDRNNLTLNIRGFARLIVDLLDDKYIYTCEGIGLNLFDEEEMEKGLRKIAKEVSPKDFEEIYKYVKVRCKHGEDENISIKANVEYYKTLAIQYPIKILGIPLSNTVSYPEQMKEWEIGNELKKINIYRSFGKIFPGITKQWVDSSYKTYGDKKKIPDSIIVLDSSGSMINPKGSVSQALVAAFSIALAYLLNNAKVDVINFSNGATVKPYKSAQSVFETLVIYKGRGTEPPYKELEELVKDNNKDVTVITDGFEGASNEDIERFMKVLSKIGKKNRVSFVYIAVNKDEYEQLKKYDNILFHYVERNDDIASIILGDVKWI